MKVCPRCGDPYADWIDFCFNDGETLRPPSAEELLAVVSEARSSTGQKRLSQDSTPLPVPGLDPVALALIAQVEAAVTESVVTVRRSFWQQVQARRQRAIRRFTARVSALGAVGCLVLALAVVVPILVGVAYLVGQPAPSRADLP